MNRLSSILLFLVAATCAPAISFEWSADIDRPAPAVFTLAEGETAQLACRLVRRGAPFNTAATNAVLYVQTNGMGRAWWTLPASVDGSLLRATVSPDSVPAASVVHAVIGASGPSGLVYRAVADLRYLPSPGYAPNAVQPPVRTLDFATVAWTNAPWALPADVSAAITAATNALPAPATGMSLPASYVAPWQSTPMMSDIRIAANSVTVVDFTPGRDSDMSIGIYLDRPPEGQGALYAIRFIANSLSDTQILWRWERDEHGEADIAAPPSVVPLGENQSKLFVAFREAGGALILSEL